MWLRVSTAGTLGDAYVEWSNDDGDTWQTAVQTAASITIDERTLEFAAGSYTTDHSYKLVVLQYVGVVNGYTHVYPSSPTDRRPVFYTTGPSGRPGPYYDGTCAGDTTNATLMAGISGANPNVEVFWAGTPTTRTTTTECLVGTWDSGGSGTVGYLTRYPVTAGNYFCNFATHGSNIADHLDPHDICVHQQGEVIGLTARIARNGLVISHNTSLSSASSVTIAHITTGGRLSSFTHGFTGYPEAFGVWVPTGNSDFAAVSNLVSRLGIVPTYDTLPDTTAIDAVLFGDLQSGDLASVGDAVAECPQTGRLSAVVSLLQASGTPPLIVGVGDVVEADSGEYATRMATLAPIADPAGVDGTKAVYVSALGNHDKSVSPSTFRSTFAWQHDAARSPAGTYYSTFVIGDTQWFILDSENWDATQKTWLHAALDASESTNKRFVYHTRVYRLDNYTASPEPKMVDAHLLAEAHGVDVVITGHTHLWTETVPAIAGEPDAGGIPYVTMPETAAYRYVCRPALTGIADTVVGDDRTEYPGSDLFAYGANATLCGFGTLSGNTLKIWDVAGYDGTNYHVRCLRTLTLA